MKTLIFLIVVLASLNTQAQEYKLAKSTGKLIIKEVNDVTVEGYSGNEIIFSSRDGSHEKDKRAEGLRAVSSLGLEDNTGLGLSVLDKGTTYEVYQMKKMDGPSIKIQVPKGVSVYYQHTSPYGSDIEFRNFEGEIETSTVHNGVHLQNVTGPLNIRTVHGEIEADLSNNLKNPISLSSVHGLVDVTLPVATKANLRMSTSWGEIFIDPAFKLEMEPKGDLVKYSSKIDGKINGGGMELTLTSTHDNIYLRKK